MTYSYKQIWTIAYPVLLALLMEHLINMTDTAFLGRVGEVELGASALAGIYYLAIYMLAFGFSIGAQILIGRRNGEKKYSEIGSIFYQGVIFLIILAAILFILSKTYSSVILDKLIDSENVYQATMKYMNWRVYGFFFSFISVMFRAFYVGTTNTKILTLNSITMVLANVVLNYALIFGKFGLPELGISGAAIASSISEMVSVIFFIIYTRFKIDTKKYGLNKFSGFKMKLLGHVLNISIWTMIQSFLAVGTWFLFFVAVEHLGERPLAITNIIRSISTLLFIAVSACATTTSTLVSNLMGAGQQQYVMNVCGKVIKLCFMLIIPVAVIIIIVPWYTLRIYTDNINLIAESIPSLMVMISSYIFFVPASIMFNAVSGTGNTRSALLMEISSLIFYAVYIYYIVLVLKSNVAVCWTSEHAYAAILFITTYIYMKKGRWQYKKI